MRLPFLIQDSRKSLSSNKFQKKSEEFLHSSKAISAATLHLKSLSQGRRRLASAHRPEDIVVRTHARSLAHRISKCIAIQPIPCYLALACDYLSSGFR